MKLMCWLSSLALPVPVQGDARSREGGPGLRLSGRCQPSPHVVTPPLICHQPCQPSVKSGSQAAV